MCSFSGANALALFQFLSGNDWSAGRVSNLINLTFSRLHGGFQFTAERRVTLNERQRQQSKTYNQGRGDAPTQDDGLQTVAACGGRSLLRRNVACTRFLHRPATRNAFMRVID